QRSLEAHVVVEAAAAADVQEHRAAGAAEAPGVIQDQVPEDPGAPLAAPVAPDERPPDRVGRGVPPLRNVAPGGLDIERHTIGSPWKGRHERPAAWSVGAGGFPRKNSAATADRESRYLPEGSGRRSSTNSQRTTVSSPRKRCDIRVR